MDGEWDQILLLQEEPVLKHNRQLERQAWRLADLANQLVDRMTL